ncbi:MAG: PQQ-binding-like beta-propeller repeat protein [Solirubrobacterales bacterium]|nr:PQQ-binding-like beta-propeller repeat protein [Solirubrobacterales bacterium]
MKTGGTRNRSRAALAPGLVLVLAFLALPGCGNDNGPDREAVDHTRTSTGNVNWPNFGRRPQRTHFLGAARGKQDPPLKQLWSFSDRVLLEFPPAVDDGIAYLADKYGNVRAIRLSDRKVLWDIQKDKRNVGPPSDTTAPAYFRGKVYVAFMAGTLAALDAKTGRVDWKRDMHSQLESSPVVVDNTLYIGSDKALLYAIDAQNGQIKWTYDAGAPVKSSPSVAGGRVIFANYSGSMFSLDARTGNRVWSTNTTKVAPFGDGGFYSSPSIAYGRIYAGRDDGTVYGFDLKTGEVTWQFRTGSDIYGSPAVGRVKGTPPTVYIGSYDSNLYALNARTGKKEWSFAVGGPVPGTATVIGRTVYTSNFKTAVSIGIDVLTHKKTFSFPSPGYTPMISDGRNLYLVGYFSLHGFTTK